MGKQFESFIITKCLVVRYLIIEYLMTLHTYQYKYEKSSYFFKSHDILLLDIFGTVRVFSIWIVLTVNHSYAIYSYFMASAIIVSARCHDMNNKPNS